MTSYSRDLPVSWDGGVRGSRGGRGRALLGRRAPPSRRVSLGRRAPLGGGLAF